MHPPRDRSASQAWHTRQVINHDSWATYYRENAGASDAPDEVLASLSAIPAELASALLCRYSRGDTLDELRDYFLHTYLPVMEAARRQYRTLDARRPLALDRERSNSWMLLFALVCFDADGSMIGRYADWFSESSKTVLYSMALKGFVPDYAYADRYDARRETIACERMVLEILLAPRDTWTGALAAFTRKWPKQMAPHGYRDHEDDDKPPFNDFPFHVAIAVCAFDIDDTPFRDLPWYPRDLVDYYLDHVRHTRDAWRTGAIDPAAGLPDSARPQQKAAPKLSKTAAYARWLELVGGTAGKRKTMPDLFELMEALAGQGVAINADIKDDETVATQLAALCSSRRLPMLDVPAPPPHGPARIAAILTVLQTHAASHGQRMALLDNEDDSWNVVLHDAASGDLFAALCEQLGIGILPDSTLLV